MQVGLVVLGLVVRSAGILRQGLMAAMAAAAAAGGATGAANAAAAAAAVAESASDRDMAVGVALIVLSAFGYSLLGCLYEWLSAVRGPAMSHAQVATSTSLIGLVATSAYQLIYTRPRWRELVADRMAQRGVGWWPVVRLYGIFGALFTAHGLVQGVVLQRSGATTVGIISALRASAVAVASGLLFCSSGSSSSHGSSGPPQLQQCLTAPAAASAGIVTGGALLWTLTGAPRPPPSPPPPPPPSLAPLLSAPATTTTAAAAAVPDPAVLAGSRISGRLTEHGLDHKHGKHH
ncbi:hypothetical protein VOLCADRAFT_97379 [Volvox carteri f. nagariensis]|uniref:EamA domain-containing protein n=1 Tax=Volvox carteri f. nagariensis TaxID=3068 RepID=D8UCL4_VOLCA|nr:uncharacterized protein VOLCADRAFT_97379 [Volvox carteri f. nagariensis]EFJ42512.1 hypothetical protein VOLCADRAFT_97379 [Volvox carteri f. nagariensis]|eukprot:XP_002956368.1 hypothetical protein VOLCADRAFT_97379 [Volvox carteri f. nagariensis]